MTHSKKSRPPCIGHISDFEMPKATFSYTGSTETFGPGVCLSRKLGLTRMGIHYESLPPGKRSSWPHAHSGEEEFVFVLEGTPQVWLDGHVYDLGPGDSVAFAAGSGQAHALINNTEIDVRLLVVGEGNHIPDKIFYPLHPARNQECRDKGYFWEGHPEHELGPHDGLPDAVKK